MKTLAVCSCLVVAFGWLSVSPSAAAEEALSGEEILARVRERGRAFEEQFVGTFSRRTVTTRVSDADSGDLQSTKDVVVDLWEYFGEHPARDVRACKVDGKDVDFGECRDEQRLEPAHRFFDEKADEHYRLEYEGLSSWKGEPSHQVRLVPLEETTRHLKGDLFYKQESLDIVGMQLTLADYPFGLQELAIEVNFASRDGLPVAQSGKSEVYIYVPFLVNDRSVTEFTASDQRLLTEREKVGGDPG